MIKNQHGLYFVKPLISVTVMDSSIVQCPNTKSSLSIFAFNCIWFHLYVRSKILLYPWSLCPIQSKLWFCWSLKNRSKLVTQPPLGTPSLVPAFAYLLLSMNAFICKSLQDGGLILWFCCSDVFTPLPQWTQSLFPAFVNLEILLRVKGGKQKLPGFVVSSTLQRY